MKLCVRLQRQRYLTRLKKEKLLATTEKTIPTLLKTGSRLSKLQNDPARVARVRHAGVRRSLPLKSFAAENGLRQM